MKRIFLWPDASIAEHPKRLKEARPEMTVEWEKIRGDIHDVDCRLDLSQGKPFHIRSKISVGHASNKIQENNPLMKLSDKGCKVPWKLG